MSHYCVYSVFSTVDFCRVLLHLFAFCLSSNIAGNEKSHWIEFPQSLQVMLQVLGTTYRFAKPASIWHLYFETLFIFSLCGSRVLGSQVAKGWSAFTEYKTWKTPILIQRWERYWHQKFRQYFDSPTKQTNKKNKKQLKQQNKTTKRKQHC